MTKGKLGSNDNNEPTQWKESRRGAVNRGNYRKQLAWEWIKRNRPDVYAVIEEEAMRKFPVKRRVVLIEIPKSLEKLK